MLGVETTIQSSHPLVAGFEHCLRRIWCFLFQIAIQLNLCMSLNRTVVPLAWRRIKAKEKLLEVSGYAVEILSFISHSHSYRGHLDYSQWPNTIIKLWRIKFLHMLHICLTHPFQLWVYMSLTSTYFNCSDFIIKFGLTFYFCLPLNLSSTMIP